MTATRWGARAATEADWASARRHAACRDADPELFFPVGTRARRYNRSRRRSRYSIDAEYPGRAGQAAFRRDVVAAARKGEALPPSPQVADRRRRQRGGRRLARRHRVGDIASAMAVRTHAHAVLVSDAIIFAARDYLWNQYRLAVEHGGATAFAALLSGAYQPAEGERIAVVLFGANTDPATLTRPAA
jgi:hypothetical protein